MIRAIAVDDDQMLLEGMRSWMAALPDITLAATYVSVEEALAAVPECDVAILDMNLRNHTNVGDNVRALLRHCPVLVVSTIPDAQFVSEAIRAGASGYLTKDSDLATLAHAVRDVAAGRDVVSPAMAFALSDTLVAHRPHLSSREQQVLWHYGRGMTLDSVARKLGIAPGTARQYLSRIKQKYQDAGRPTYTKVDMADRIREDRLDLDGLGPQP